MGGREAAFWAIQPGSNRQNIKLVVFTATFVNLSSQVICLTGGIFFFCRSPSRSVSRSPVKDDAEDLKDEAMDGDAAP